MEPYLPAVGIGLAGMYMTYRVWESGWQGCTWLTGCGNRAGRDVHGLPGVGVRLAGMYMTYRVWGIGLAGMYITYRVW